LQHYQEISLLMLLATGYIYFAFAKASAVGLLATSLATTPLDAPRAQPLPVLEIVKVYGKLAGTECYGKSAPIDSSCEATLRDIEAKFQLEETKSLTRESFREQLNIIDFQWPLKPYGVDKSLSKTATMNKGAETRVYMEELESRGLYDRRNPTGPLPTSLRPQLNAALQREGISARTADIIFDALGGTNGRLEAEQISVIFSHNLDYYGFLDLLGKDSVIWPY
jgi:hypothetical protein